ncbi:MAG: hypothetical protein KatS3mg124_1777 [Porticoccaceae bacterium]|nr:MAG: hypothetical protein KatS3mg124_1777 [Porticoccaceae bacterium]
MTEPIRIGVLDDLAAGEEPVVDVARWLRLAADELAAAGRLDRPLEILHGLGRGLPAGSAAAVERAFRALAGEGVLLVVGPAVGDNALAIAPLAERLELPTLNWAGSELARGSWNFHLQVGSHEEEPELLAEFLARRGARRVIPCCDRSPIGARYRDFFLAAAERAGLSLAGLTSCPPLAADPAALELPAATADALVYLGFGAALPALAAALAERGTPPLLASSSAALRGHHDPALARALEGWHYVDLYHEGNPVLAALLARPHCQGAHPAGAARGWDLARLALEGIARSPRLDRAGVRAGLEAVKRLPAAQGHPGTLLGFGHWQRAALQGPYLVLRRWRDGRSEAVAD